MSAGDLLVVPLHEIAPWPDLNPRTSFAKEQLEELADSIKKDGLLQPVAAAPAGPEATNGTKYWLFAGERRLRASKLAGVETIKVIISDVDEKTAHRLAGLENLDREELSPIEEAEWCARELELNPELGQKELGEAIGRSQAWVANRIRLLQLPKAIVALIHSGALPPALARDHLLRFTKLRKDVAKKLFSEIAKQLKKQSSIDVAQLRNAVDKAMEKAKALSIRPGYYYRSHNSSVTISTEVAKAFRKAHPDMCVKAHRGGWHGEDDWTFAVKEWNAVLDEEAAKQRSTRSTGGVSKKKLEKPGLGPKKKPVEIRALETRFGYGNILDFDQIVDPSKIDPKSVARAVGWNGKERLVFVGPNVTGLKGSRTRLVKPAYAAAANRIAKGRLKKASKQSASKTLMGLIALALRSDLFNSVQDLLVAEGIDVPDKWTQYSNHDVAKLGLSEEQLERVAAAAAALAMGNHRHGALERQVSDTAEQKVTRDTAAAREAWKREHGFAEASDG